MMSRNVRSVSGKARWTRTIKVAPIPRAVRSAMAASAIVIAGTGSAFAGHAATVQQAPQALRYDVDASNTLSAAVQPQDLTLVAGSDLPASVARAAVSAGDGTARCGTGWRRRRRR